MRLYRCSGSQMIFDNCIRILVFLSCPSWGYAAIYSGQKHASVMDSSTKQQTINGLVAGSHYRLNMPFEGFKKIGLGVENVTWLKGGDKNQPNHEFSNVSEGIACHGGAFVLTEAKKTRSIDFPLWLRLGWVHCCTKCFASAVRVLVRFSVSLF